MQVHGSCHCGAIAYEADVDPELVGLCNCTDCQRLTGTAFRVSVPVPSASFRMLRGEPRIYLKTADSGRRRRHAFCATCSAPVYACGDTDAPSTYSLRVGCLDERASLPPRIQLWCSSALGWVKALADVPGVERQ